MITAKKNINGEVRPDLPQGTSYRITADHGDSFEVEVTAWPKGYVREISKLQGKAELLNRGLLDTVKQSVAQQGGLVQLAWEEATVWRRDTAIVQQMAVQLDIDLDGFFEKAAKIEL